MSYLSIALLLFSIFSVSLSQKDYDVRLVGGTTDNEGRIEVFLLFLNFGADRLLEEGSDPFGARPVVNLAFLRFAGLGEDLRARCRPRLSTVAFG